MILYIMLCGQPPFPGKNPKEIVLAIQKGIYTFSKKGFQGSSMEVTMLPPTHLRLRT